MKQQIFVVVWLLGSIVFSAYFAFWLFPDLYLLRNGRTVILYFETRRKDGTYVYYPNSPVYRKVLAAELSDDQFLYYSNCDALPMSQRPYCDRTDNWQGLTPELAGCSSVRSCDKQYYGMSEVERYSALNGIQPAKGEKVVLPDIAPLSLTDPLSWGDVAKWPVFFISMFFGLKLGSTAREFVFGKEDGAQPPSRARK